MPEDVKGQGLNESGAERLGMHAVAATLARAEDPATAREAKGWGYDADGDELLAPPVGVRGGPPTGYPGYSLEDEVAADSEAGEAAVRFGVRHRGRRSSQGSSIGFMPPLYPAHARRTYLRTVMRALVRFIHRYGYWPRLLELTWSMRAYLPGVRWTLRELDAIGYVEKDRLGQFRLTEIAWNALCLVPIEPWTVRPHSTFRHRTVRRFAAAIAASAGWEPAALTQRMRLQGPPPQRARQLAKAAAQRARGLRGAKIKRGAPGLHTPKWYEKMMQPEEPQGPEGN